MVTMGRPSGVTLDLRGPNEWVVGWWERPVNSGAHWERKFHGRKALRAAEQFAADLDRLGAE